MHISSAAFPRVHPLHTWVTTLASPLSAALSQVSIFTHSVDGGNQAQKQLIYV